MNYATICLKNYPSSILCESNLATLHKGGATVVREKEFGEFVEESIFVARRRLLQPPLAITFHVGDFVS